MLRFACPPSLVVREPVPATEEPKFVPLAAATVPVARHPTVCIKHIDTEPFDPFDYVVWQPHVSSGIIMEWTAGELNAHRISMQGFILARDAPKIAP
jgi:hypothetical protein